MGAGGQKMLQNFLESAWWTEYAKSNNIWIIWDYDINQNILAVLRAFSNLEKKQKLNVLAKFLTERKYLMKTLTFVRRENKHL